MKKWQGVTSIVFVSTQEKGAPKNNETNSKVKSPYKQKITQT